MNNDLISRKALREDLRRFFPAEVLEGIEPKTLFAQIMHDIDNAPTVELFCSYLSDGEVRQPCVEAPCEQEMSQAFINGIVELISKNGITTIDELLETLKGDAE